jgi:N-methylhydantoinase B
VIAIGGYETEAIRARRGARRLLGRRSGRDGLEGVSNPLANLSNQPVEMVESELPLRCTRYGLVADSGGPGRSAAVSPSSARTSCWPTRRLTVLPDRRSHPPYGIEGGRRERPRRTRS